MLAVGKGAYLVIYDISDPAAPTERSRLLTPGAVNMVEIDGTWIYVSTGTEGLYIIDAIDPYDPLRIVGKRRRLAPRIRCVWLLGACAC